MKKIVAIVDIIGVVVFGLIALIGLGGVPADDTPIVWYVVTLVGSKVVGVVAGYYAYKLAEHLDLLIRANNN